MSVILIVEDNASLIRLYSKALQRLEADILPVLNCRQAFDMLSLVTPDVVVLDMNLPDGDGLSIIDYMKTRPNLKFTKVVVVTAEDRFRDPAQRRNIDRFFSKPVGMATLSQAVRDLVSASQTQRNSTPL